MKAKEYFEYFLNVNKEDSPEKRLLDCINKMVLEVSEIRKIRNAKTDSAMISIFKEMEVKSHAFIKMVNETEPFKSNGEVKYDAFKLYINQTSPELFNLIWK